MADPRDDDSVPASPPPAVLDAFRKQLTAAFMQDARRYARKRAKLVRVVGRRHDPNDYHELVQQALHDTWRGAAWWDPAEKDLLDHVRDLIKQRTSNERRRLANEGERHQGPRHVSLDAPSRAANDEVSSTGLTIAEQTSDAQLADGTVNPARVFDLLRRVIVELHRLAARDVDARAILGCWAKGVIEPSDVMTLTGFSERHYYLVRDRILYLAKYLPPELREAVEDLLRSAS